MGRGLGFAELDNKAEVEGLELEPSRVGWGGVGGGGWWWWWRWGKAGNKAKAQLQLGLWLS